MCINLMPFENDFIATIFCRFNIEQWEFKARTQSLLKNCKFKMGKKNSIIFHGEYWNGCDMWPMVGENVFGKNMVNLLSGTGE